MKKEMTAAKKKKQNQYFVKALSKGHYVGLNDFKLSEVQEWLLAIKGLLYMLPVGVAKGVL